jgi:hypothetical protein
LAETLQLEEVRVIYHELHDAPKLLVEWTPRWADFVTSIGPAFARSGPRLAGEASHGGFPYGELTASLALQLLLLLAVMFLPREIDRLRPYAAPRLRPDEVIYYSGDELPRTEDLSGSESGANGRAGGLEAHHRTQTIHVARGISLAEKVVDAPHLKLPSSAEAVANLLAFKSAAALPNAPPVPPSPSADGLHSALIAPALSANVIAPAEIDVAREHSRGGLTLTAIVPPAPGISAEKSRTIPSLKSEVVPPAPTTPSEYKLIAPRLDSSIIGPAPSVSRRHPLATPSLNANVIAPASTHVTDEQARFAPSLNAGVIPPAPETAGRVVPATRVLMSNVAVVPPPVSAPERDSVRKAKLNLPAPSVVAPPPAADSSHELRRLESGVAASAPTVVPPPPTQASGTSFVSGIIGKIFGTQDVVPPPPRVSADNRVASDSVSARVVPPPPNISSTNRSAAERLAAKVVPPAPSASANFSNENSRRASRTPNATVVPPPPSVGVSRNPGASAAEVSRGALAENIVPPPPSVPGADSSKPPPGRDRNSNAFAPKVVAPPPSVGGRAGLSASSRGGFAHGAVRVLAPPKTPSGNADNSGVVLSAQPGSNVAMPGNGGKHSLAMSPSGGNTPGIGGSGGGTGIGRGQGPASGLAAPKIAETSGAGKTGSGRGSDAIARNGISPNPGPGGAGSVPTGSPAVPGVDVRGGSTIVTLPSFGSNGGDPSFPRRSNLKTDQGPAITIVATSRSGGAFDFYGKLPGDNYTVYLDTSMGTVVMQFAEANPASRAQAETLTGPEAIRTTLPAGLAHARMVVKCRLDTAGNISNLQVLEAGPATMTAKIVAALPAWKFRPAMRGSKPVEINAILGFNIDTNDRY